MCAISYRKLIYFLTKNRILFVNNKKMIIIIIRLELVGGYFVFVENKTEFKWEYVEDIKNTIIAFTNCDGGTLYIGMNDDGTVCGVDHVDDTMLRVTNAVRDAVRPDRIICKEEEFARRVFRFAREHRQFRQQMPSSWIWSGRPVVTVMRQPVLLIRILFLISLLTSLKNGR